MSSRPALATEVELGSGSEMAQHVKGTLAEPDLSFIPGIHTVGEENYLFAPPGYQGT